MSKGLGMLVRITCHGASEAAELTESRSEDLLLHPQTSIKQIHMETNKQKNIHISSRGKL